MGIELGGQFQFKHNWNSILGLLLWFTDDNTEASLVEENQNALEGLDAMFGQVG